MTEIQYVLKLLRTKEVRLNQLSAMNKINDIYAPDPKIVEEQALVKEARIALKEKFPEEFI